MEVTAAGIGATATAITAIATLAGVTIRDALAVRDAKIANVRDSIKLLFEKHDAVVKEMNEYRLRVAETYVNREVLHQQLEPINAALKEIRDEMREDRRE